MIDIYLSSYMPEIGPTGFVFRDFCNDVLHIEMMKDQFISMTFEKSNVTGFSVGAAQHCGTRPYQEDSFGYTGPEQKSCFMAVISDGMGGLSSGDKVSRYSADSMLQMCAQNDAQPVHIRFTQTLHAINDAILARKMNGGATLSAVYCSPGGIYWCSTGDSRIYLWRNEMLFQLSRDFDYMDVLLDKVISCQMSFEEAAGDIQKDTLAQYIGAEMVLRPDVNIKPLVPERGDRIMICSDGVYNSLDNAELTKLLADSAQSCADNILNSVIGKNYENQDNCTAIVLSME